MVGVASEQMFTLKMFLSTSDTATLVDPRDEKRELTLPI